MAEAPHVGEQVTVTLVSARVVTVYKALAGADATLGGYNQRCVAVHVDDESRSVAEQLARQEWRGMYTQFRRDHVLGTVPYRWEDPDVNEATLVAVTFDDVLDVVVIDGPLMHAGGVCGSVKAAEVKRLLGIDLSMPLVPSLGERGQVALARETADEWELVVPHALLAANGLRYNERAVARFRRHRAMPVTARWMAGSDVASAWHAWDTDGEGKATDTTSALAGCIPDLDMAWLPQLE